MSQCLCDLLPCPAGLLAPWPRAPEGLCCLSVTPVLRGSPGGQRLPPAFLTWLRYCQEIETLRGQEMRQVLMGKGGTRRNKSEVQGITGQRGPRGAPSRLLLGGAKQLGLLKALGTHILVAKCRETAFWTNQSFYISVQVGPEHTAWLDMQMERLQAQAYFAPFWCDFRLQLLCLSLQQR